MARADSKGLTSDHIDRERERERERERVQDE